VLKIRITYNKDNKKELDKAIEKLEKEFNILNKSRIYEGRGQTKYNNIYLDVENK
jgi:hypothetical protein